MTASQLDINKFKTLIKVITQNVQFMYNAYEIDLLLYSMLQLILTTVDTLKCEMSVIPNVLPPPPLRDLHIAIRTVNCSINLNELK